jgi:RNA polymerase sigma-70 factor, ECF subfamily
MLLQILVTNHLGKASYKQVERQSSQFWQLIENEHRKARAYCGRLTGNTEDGDDLYQDSVINAYRGFAGLRKTDSFKPWFYQIITNTFRGRRRTTWWKRILPDALLSIEQYGSSNPVGEYDARRRLEFAFTALSAEDRVFVTLAELEGWTISEIAAMAGRTEGFIKMRLSRARNKMRKRLTSIWRAKFRQEQEQGNGNVCCATRPEND